jgi:hypothetical protein
MLFTNHLCGVLDVRTFIEGSIMTTPEKTENRTIIGENSAQLACSTALSRGKKSKKLTKAELIAALAAEGIERKQLSFPQWCASRGFSESTGRNIRKVKLDPKRTGVGRLKFVTPEADAEWFLMWQQGGEEQFAVWQREQRERRKQQQPPQAGV